MKSFLCLSFALITASLFGCSSSSSSDSPSFCEEYGLTDDASTLYFNDFDSAAHGTLITGVCGKAIALESGESDTLDFLMEDSIPVGTAEFWFRPHSDFYDEDSRVLLGTNEARMLFYYADGTLYFQKNISEVYVYVGVKTELDSGWNLIAAEWGNDSISLYLNDSLIAQKSVAASGYQPYYDDPIIIGKKTACCLDVPGYNEDMTTSGDFDQLRISKVKRY